MHAHVYKRVIPIHTYIHIHTYTHPSHTTEHVHTHSPYVPHIFNPESHTSGASSTAPVFQGVYYRSALGAALSAYSWVSVEPSLPQFGIRIVLATLLGAVTGYPAKRLKDGFILAHSSRGHSVVAAEKAWWQELGAAGDLASVVAEK